MKDCLTFSAIVYGARTSATLKSTAFIGRQAHLGDSRAAIVLDKVNGATIRNCRAAEGTGVFLQAVDVNDGRLFVNNDLSNAQQTSRIGGISFPRIRQLRVEVNAGRAGLFCRERVYCNRLVFFTRPQNSRWEHRLIRRIGIMLRFEA